MNPDTRSLLLMIAVGIGAGFKLPFVFWLWVLIEGVFLTIDRAEQLLEKYNREPK